MVQVLCNVVPVRELAFVWNSVDPEQVGGGEERARFDLAGV